MKLPVETNTAFEGYVVATLENMDKTMTKHDGATADIAKDVRDLQEWKWKAVGVIGCITFIIGVVIALIN